MWAPTVRLYFSQEREFGQQLLPETHEFSNSV